MGLVTPTTSLLGADAAVHMAEELRDASKTLPRVMIWTTALNSILGFVMLMYDNSSGSGYDMTNKPQYVRLQPRRSGGGHLDAHWISIHPSVLQCYRVKRRSNSNDPDSYALCNRQCHDQHGNRIASIVGFRPRWRSAILFLVRKGPTSFRNSAERYVAVFHL